MEGLISDNEQVVLLNKKKTKKVSIWTEKMLINKSNHHNFVKAPTSEGPDNGSFQ